jgi:hypothetical protein
MIVYITKEDEYTVFKFMAWWKFSSVYTWLIRALNKWDGAWVILRAVVLVQEVGLVVNR